VVVSDEKLTCAPTPLLRFVVFKQVARQVVQQIKVMEYGPNDLQLPYYFRLFAVLKSFLFYK